MESNEISRWIDADGDTDIAGMAAATSGWPEMKKGNASTTNTERRKMKDMKNKMDIKKEKRGQRKHIDVDDAIPPITGNEQQPQQYQSRPLPPTPTQKEGKEGKEGKGMC